MKPFFQEKEFSFLQLRDSLELSFVADAEMAFTTLSSTGRRVFNRLQPGHFETVLIDEAAQASEVTTLQALTFGCRRYTDALQYLPFVSCFVLSTLLKTRHPLYRIDQDVSI